MNILVVEDNLRWRELFSEVLASSAYAFELVETISEALQKLAQNQYDIVCMNYNIGSLGNGRTLLRELVNSYEQIPVILITGAFDGEFERTSQIIRNLQDRYPNLAKVLIKGSTDIPSQSFYESFQDSLDHLRTQQGRNYMSIIPPPITKESKTVAWIHLSDLHFGHSKNTAQPLLDALIADIQTHQKPSNEQPQNCVGIQLQPTFLFITGDIAYRATRAEYKEAGAFIQNIWKVTQLTKEKTFIIPGNHDVHRAVATTDPMYKAAYKELIDGNLDEEKWYETFLKWWTYPQLRKLWKKKFRPYFNFKNYYMESTNDLCHYVYSIEQDGFKLDIIGLNSALMSWKDGEDIERGLCIGKPQLDSLEKKISPDASFRIALVHHPPDALQYHDTSWQRLEELCDVILHGHVHKSEVLPSAHPERKHVRIVGGAINQNGSWHSQRYSYCVFNFETRDLDIYMRRTRPGAYPYYIRDNETFGKVAPNGHLRISLK